MTSPWREAEITSYPTEISFGPEGAAWPTFAERWLGGEYPAGRGLKPQQAGWCCAGCRRGYAPWVRMCGHCGPAAEPSATTDCTWSPDAAEPDES